MHRLFELAIVATSGLGNAMLFVLQWPGVLLPLVIAQLAIGELGSVVLLVIELGEETELATNVSDGSVARWLVKSKVAAQLRTSYLRIGSGPSTSSPASSKDLPLRVMIISCISRGESILMYILYTIRRNRFFVLPFRTRENPLRSDSDIEKTIAPSFGSLILSFSNSI